MRISMASCLGGAVLALTLVLLATTPTQAAGWGELVEGFFKLFARSEPVLGKAGAHSAAEAIATTRPLGSLVLGEELAARMSAQEAREFEAAVARVDVAQFQPLREALAVVANGTRPLDKSVPFDAELPFLRVRATGISAYDDALVAFARARLTPTLEQRFAVEDLRIIPFGMSEDAAVSAKEVAKYTVWLPPAQRDTAGPLARLARGELGDLDIAGRAAALAPYRGQTVVLVGHTPAADEGRFVAWTANGMQTVDLTEWMKAAVNADVNLIPIGCNSGHFLQLGAADFVNSADVLQRLMAVIAERPQTLRGFFGKLTGDDLELLIDPTSTRFFDNTVEILKRESRERVGRIFTNLKREAPSIAERLYETLPRASSYPNYGPCFAREDAAAFDSCAADAQRTLEVTRAAEARTAAAQGEKSLHEQRSRLLELLPEARTAAAAVEDQALRIWVIWILCFLVVWPLAALTAPYSYLIWCVQDIEPQLSTWRAFTDPAVIRQFLPLVFTHEYWRDVNRSEGGEGIFQGLPLLIGCGLVGIAFWNVFDYEPDTGVPLGGIAIYVCAAQLFWVAISLLRSEAGPPMWLSFLLTLVMLGSAWPLYVSGEAFASAHADTRNMATMWSAAISDNPEVWRNELEFMPSHLSELIEKVAGPKNDAGLLTELDASPDDRDAAPFK